MTVYVTTRTTEIVIQGTTANIDLRIVDADGEPVDATALSLKLIERIGGATVYEDDFFDPPDPPGTTRIVHPETGRYYFKLGDQTPFPIGDQEANEETESVRELLAQWHFEVAGGEDSDNHVQLVEIISPKTAGYLVYLRQMIDKASKRVDDDPDDSCYLGYTDSMLVQFLKGGLSWINAFQPYPMWRDVDCFPDIHWRILIDAAMFDALSSQEIFAVDTDINWNDQGNSLIIEHQPKLSQILSVLWQRMVATIPPMKKHYMHSGVVRVEAGPNFRMQQLVQAAPSGTLFNNLYQR